MKLLTTKIMLTHRGDLTKGGDWTMSNMVNKSLSYFLAIFLI